MKRMVMKKLLLCGLISALAISTVILLAGCGGSEDEDQPSEQTEQEQAQEPEQAPPAKTTDEKIDDMIADMSLEEKVGQMFIVRCPHDGNDVSAISDYYIGSYILFADDFQPYTADEVKSHIQTYQETSKVPMLIGVDEEGGTVNRISSYTQFRSTPFQAPRDLYANGGLDNILEDNEEKCQLLKNLGVNLNFAPVCDISTNPTDFIYSRSLGQDAETTGQYVAALVKQYNQQNVGCVLKHFPGYGNNADTHTGIAYDNRDLSIFEGTDFVPFEKGIEAGNTCVLVSHNVVKAMDADMPASLSKNVHDILRNEMNFKGVIMTDDLSMGAITEFCGDKTAAVTAVSAGNDMLCCDDYSVQIPAVVQAVKSGEIKESRIDESVHRILLWKNQLGLLKL